MAHFFIKHFHLINIPPLFYITLFFSIGLMCKLFLMLFFITFLLLVCYALLAYVKQLPIPKQLILCSFFTLCGAWLHQKEIRDYNKFYALVENKKFTVSGTVVDMYEVTVHYKKSTVIAVALDTIATENCATKNSKIMLFYTKSNNSITVGDTITFFDIR